MSKAGRVAAIVIMAMASALAGTGTAEKSADAVEARIAHVESGLLAGNTVVKGEPDPGMKLADRMAFYKVPGVSIAVINNGKVEWARGYGVLEAGTQTPVTAHTRFQAASISKSIAALVAMRVVEQGKVSLDEPVNSRLVSWKVPENDFTKDHPVTLRELLSHTAGMTVHGFAGYQADGPVPTLLQVLDGEKPANSDPIRVDVQPGTLYRYSGGGYTVMQQLLIDVTGKPFPQLASELVLKPVGMTESGYTQPLPAELRNVAASGHYADGKVVPAKYHTYTELTAAGLWTTATDLARFAIEIQRAAKGQSKVLNEATVRQMLTPVKGSYGLGLSMSGKDAAARFGHSGSNEGFKCEFVAYLETGQGAAVMTNGDGGSALTREILFSIARAYGWADLGPKERTKVQVAPEVLRQYEGRYDMGADRKRPNRIFTVVLEGNRLFLVDGDHRSEMYPASDTSFFQLSGGEITFEKDADGRITQLVMGGNIKAKRLPQ